MRHEFEHLQETVKDREAWRAAQGHRTRHNLATEQQHSNQGRKDAVGCSFLHVKSLSN